MSRISPEEKRRESADWFKGIISLAIILGVLLAGYMIYQGTKKNLTQQETSPKETQNAPTNTPGA